MSRRGKGGLCEDSDAQPRIHIFRFTRSGGMQLSSELNWKSFLFLLAQRHSQGFPWRFTISYVEARFPCLKQLDECFPRIVKHVRQSINGVRDIQGSFFCRLPDQDECTDALAVTRDGSPRELQGMDWNASFDAMGQRHKNAVRVCQNEKVALIGEKFPKQPVSVSHFWINTNDQITRKRSMHSMLKSSGLVSTRIEGWTEKKIAYMLESGRVLLPSSLNGINDRRSFFARWLAQCTCQRYTMLMNLVPSWPCPKTMSISTNFSRSLMCNTSAPHEWRCYKF